jgi:hypothetical protein
VTALRRETDREAAWDLGFLGGQTHADQMSAAYLLAFKAGWGSAKSTATSKRAGGSVLARWIRPEKV